MAVIGFTGTRKGMTPKQQQRLIQILDGHKGYGIFHHGCCMGADLQFHLLVRRLFGKNATIVGHRMIPATKQSGMAVEDCTQLREPLPPLVRNQNIVDEVTFGTGLMLACPADAVEAVRGSGTWATIRRSRKAGVDLIIVYPDGSVGQ